MLRQLEATPVPAPVALAVSDGGNTDGAAALLMTRVTGHIDLAPLAGLLDIDQVRSFGTTRALGDHRSSVGSGSSI